MTARAWTWLRRNLFRTPVDGVVTVVFGAISLYVVWRLVRFVLVTGRWDIIRVNLRLLMIGRFPEAHVLRLAVTVVVIAAWAGLIAGIIRARQVRAGRAGVHAGLSAARVRDLVDRFWLAGVVVLLLLALSSTPGPWITTGLAVVAAVLGRLVGPFIGRWRLGARGGAVLVVALGAVPIVLFVYVVDGAGVDTWGGFLLNLFLATLFDRVVLSDRRVVRARPAVEAPARPAHLDALHRDSSAAPRCSCCCCSPTRRCSSSCPPTWRRRRQPGRSSCSRSSPAPTWPRSCAAACSRFREGRSRRPRRSACRPSARPAWSSCRRRCAT